jgi:hypothetical protein
MARKVRRARVSDGVCLADLAYRTKKVLARFLHLKAWRLALICLSALTRKPLEKKDISP